MKHDHSEQQAKMESLSRQSRETLRQMEERMQGFSQRLLEAQERERKAIGRELHDELGGYLTILGLSLSKMAKEPDKDIWFKQVQQTVDEMAKHVRALSHMLYPAALESEGLLPALAAYFDNYHRRTGIRVSFTQRGLDRRLPRQIEATSYRIVQEALTNVAKHAAVDRVQVHVSHLKNRINISVKDRGQGFDTGNTSMTGYGIAGMRDRAMIAGGALRLDSSPGQGTRVFCTLPLQHTGGDAGPSLFIE